MLKIEKRNEKLLLAYNTHDGTEWIFEKLQKDGVVRIIHRAFTFTEEDILSEEKSPDDEFDEFDDIRFILGKKEENYYKVEAHILNMEYDLYLSEDMRISAKTFIVDKDISIFQRIGKLVSEPIYVGGNAESAIPVPAFKALLSKFPTKTEIKHYTESKISMILKDYLETTTDAQVRLRNYLKKKPLLHAVEKTSIRDLHNYEIQKYEYIRDRIQEELKHQATYSEEDWQELMIKFILLIFPKYIAVLRGICLKDYYSKKEKVTFRYADIALVDTDGNIDIIEIKKPFDNCLVSVGEYRGNFIPKKELAGAIMQVEKYIFHLSKWGIDGEKKITRKYAKELPKDMEIKITNPKGLVILGRSEGLTAKQKFDLEIIRRKYANIMDIITYDDLLARLNNIIEKFKKKK